MKYIVSYSPKLRTDIIASAPEWEWRPKTTRAHYNHVHISIHSGAQVEDSIAPLFNTPIPEKPWPKEWEADVPKPSDVVDVLVTDYGTFKLKADGSIETDAPSWGSYFSIPNQEPRLFVAITTRRDGHEPGYTIWANDASNGYDFGPDIVYS